MRIGNKRRRWACGLTLVLLVGCARETRWTKYEVCFGLSRDAGRSVIAGEEWDRFVGQEIVPRFPDGFTVYDARGYWREDERTFEEGAKVLMIVTPTGREPDNAIDAIRSAYRERFNQGSVLKIQTDAKVEF